MRAGLKITTGKETGRTFVLRPGQTFLIGRGGRVTIKLTDPEISRRHAQLALREAGLTITDLRSSNGTEVDGAVLEPDRLTPLSDGQTIKVGQHRLTVELSAGVPPEQREAWRREDARFLSGEVLGLLDGRATCRTWAVRQDDPRRTVAVKVLRPTGGVDLSAILKRIESCRQLRSPHVAELYEARQEDGALVLTQELIEGSSAQDRLAQGPLPLHEALRISVDVALALESAEQAGVVHGGLGPQNILLGPDETTKLCDLGRGVELAPHGAPHAAPEHLHHAPDSRADIFGLGATLYHLLVGAPPEIPPRSISKQRHDCPSALERLVLEMLEHDPEKRPQPASFVARTLEELKLQHAPDQDDTDRLRVPVRRMTEEELRETQTDG